MCGFGFLRYYQKYKKLSLKDSTHLYFDCLDSSKTKAVIDIHGGGGGGAFAAFELLMVQPSGIVTTQ